MRFFVSRLCVIALILLSTAGKSQIDTVIYQKFSARDLKHYMVFQQGYISASVYQLIEDGKINAHKDSLLKQKYTTEGFKKYVEKHEHILMYGPNWPEVSSDLIDTLLITPFDPYYTKGFVFNENNSVSFILEDTTIVYLNRSELFTQLKGLSAAVLKYYYTKGGIVAKEGKMVDFVEKEFVSLARRLYEWGRHGSLTAYQNDSFTTKYDTLEIEERVSPIQTGGSIDSVTGEFVPEYVFRDFFTPDSIKRISVRYIVTTDKEMTYQSTLYAIAPCFQPIVAGLKLPWFPIFQIKASDFLQKLTPEEKEFYRYFFYYLIQQ